MIYSTIKEMEVRSATVPGAISLAQGVSNFDTPDCIKKAAIQAIKSGKAAQYSFSAGLLELREAIEYHLAKQNIFYDFQEEIIVTAGAKEGIAATLLALLEPGDEVLVSDPGHISHYQGIDLARAKAVTFELSEKNDWQLDINEIEKKITPKTKAILLCNPNNPTGAILTKEQAVKLLELADCHNLFVLSEEVYQDFTYDETDFCSLAQFSNFRQHIIHVFSFSKTYAMTGWRIAYIAADEKLSNKILKAHNSIMACAPVVSQWGALAALEMAQQNSEYFRKQLAKRRETMCAKLDEMRDFISYKKPHSGYFIFPKLNEKILNYYNQLETVETNGMKPGPKVNIKNSVSWKFALELLYKGKVAIIPGRVFGKMGEKHFRICFGKSEKSIIAGCNLMHKYFKQLPL